jgi:hypothetical protein
MAFANEHIPAEDKKRYNITDDGNFYLAGTNRWTVDREHDMFLLRRTGIGPESIPGQIRWAFYWRGHLLDVLLLSFPMRGDESSSCAWAHKKVLRIDGMTPELEIKRSQIIEDLRDGLIVDREFGLLGDFKFYELTLDAE